MGKGLWKITNISRVICKSSLMLMWFPVNTVWHNKCLDLQWWAWGTFWQQRLHAFPRPGKAGNQPQTPSVLRNRRKGPGGKKPATAGPRTAVFAVVWIKWMNIFRPAYFTPRDWTREQRGGDVAVWAKSRVERKNEMGQERDGKR